MSDDNDYTVPTVPAMVDLTGLAEALRAISVDARIEQTGGGTATLYAGAGAQIDQWTVRYGVSAGSGHFERSRAVAYWEEFSYGPDDDDLAIRIETPISLASLAQSIALMLDTNGWPRTAAEAADRTFTVGVREEVLDEWADTIRAEAVDRFASAIMTMVAEDIEGLAHNGYADSLRRSEGLRRAQSFADLHDYVDANEYTIHANVPYLPDSDLVMSFFCDVHSEVSRRLANRTNA